VTEQGKAAESPVEFTSELTPLLLAQVLTGGTVLSPLMLTIMFAGPLFLVIGTLMKGAILLQWGYTLLVALPAVPLITFAVSYLTANGKRSREVLLPLGVRADDGGLELAVGDETRIAEWSDFSRWRRMAGTHLLYITPRTFVILRTDGLDAASRAAFEGLLRAHIPSGPRR
jgi:hypothetical protein